MAGNAITRLPCQMVIDHGLGKIRIYLRASEAKKRNYKDSLVIEIEEGGQLPQIRNGTKFRINCLRVGLDVDWNEHTCHINPESHCAKCGEMQGIDR